MDEERRLSDEALESIRTVIRQHVDERQMGHYPADVVFVGLSRIEDYITDLAEEIQRLQSTGPYDVGYERGTEVARAALEEARAEIARLTRSIEEDRG